MVAGEAFCGLDFGTSNSALCAGAGQGSLRLIPLEKDNFTIPSAIFFNTEENRVVFGREGLTEYRTGYEGRLLRALKSILGSELIDEATQIGNQKKSFRDIIGIFISHIKDHAEMNLQAPLANIVMGRPVHFVDDDNMADQRAENELRGIAEKAGFKNIYFEYEPIAAARDYESTIEKEEIVLVFDIGGGTSDFSVIRLSPEARNKRDRADDILGNHGIHIGGTNFDQKLSLQTVMKDLGYQSGLKNKLDMPGAPYFSFSTWHLINTLYNQKTISGLKLMLPQAEERDLLERFIYMIGQQRGHELAELVEKAKIDLSENSTVLLDASKFEQGWNCNITSSTLQLSIGADMDKIVSTACDTVIKFSNAKLSDIDTIFLTGGSTGLPGFEQRVKAIFPQARLVFGDRFSSVAKGLGFAAAKIFV